MKTIEIPKQDWPQFLNELSERATDHSVRIEVDNLDIGSQEMTRLNPLQDIDLETEGSDTGALEITVGGKSMDLSHRIEKPTRLYLRLSSGLQIDCLEVEDADGGKTLIFFEDLTLLPGGKEAPASPP